MKSSMTLTEFNRLPRKEMNKYKEFKENDNYYKKKEVNEHNKNNINDQFMFMNMKMTNIIEKLSNMENKINNIENKTNNIENKINTLCNNKKLNNSFNDLLNF